MARIQTAAPALAALPPVVQEFERLVREQVSAAYLAWRESALTSDLSDLHHFVAGLDRDRTVVVAVLELP